MSLNPLTYQPRNTFQKGAAMFTASCFQLQLELLVCDRSVLVNVITHTFVGLKCLTETQIQILCDHINHTHFDIVEMVRQMVQLLSAHIVRPTMCINLTPALGWNDLTDIFTVFSNISHKRWGSTLVYYFVIFEPLILVNSSVVSL